MNFDEIVVKESPGLCRCCLSEGCYKDLGSEYTWMNDTEVYADMLLDCFDIGITQHNGGPNGAKRLICEVCITRLRDACNFKKQVLDSEKRFIDMLGRGEFRPKVLIYQQQSRELKAETVEDPSDEADLTEVEYLEELDYGGDEEIVKSEELQTISIPTTSDKPDPPKPKRGRPRKEEEKPSKPTKLVKKPKVAKDETAQLYEKRRENLKVLFNHTSVVPFKWKSKYTCFYCKDSFTGYTKLRKHTESHRPYTKKTLKSIATYREIKIDVSKIVCYLCHKEFKSFTDIVDHLTEYHCKLYHKSVISFQEYRLCDLRCVICQEKFSNFKMLAVHVHSHAKGQYECDDCGRQFNEAADIVLHIRSQHVANDFVCLQCSKRYVDASQLKTHVRRVHLRQCTMCDAKFKNVGSLKQHIAQEHRDDGGTKCGFCLKEFPSAEEIRFHLPNCEVKALAKGANGDNITLPNKRYKSTLCHQIRRNIQCVLNMSTAVPFKFKGKFSCFYCSHWVSDFDELIVHTRTEHPVCELKSRAMQTCKGEKACVKLDINGLACKICQQPMPDLQNFVDHAIAEHGADFEKSVPFKDCFETFHLTQGRIPCPECQEPFAYFATLLKHLGAEHNHHKAVCAYCGRGCRTTASLAMHISNSHTGMCECANCGAKCKNSAALARHMARYHDAKDFKCSHCPEQFETIYKKQNHLIKAHNIGHKCAHCGKMFTRNSFMMNHVRRTHLKERTVPCSVCHMKFFDRYHMKLHMVKHEGMRRFRCEDCGKCFLRVRNLKSHMDTHRKGHILPGVF